jgi:hypothetical protein
VGLGSYLGLSLIERNTASYRFRSTVDSAVSILDVNLQKMDKSLRLMAQLYVEGHSTLADWPTVALPSFHTSAALVREISGADAIGFSALVKPADVSRYEAFMFDYWDSDPNIPPGMAGYYNAAGGRGVWAVNDTGNAQQISSPAARYHDTTGATTWGENNRIFPLSQVLFGVNLTPRVLGFNFYAIEQQGEALERMVQCVEDSRYVTLSPMLFCLYAYMLICLYAYILICLYAYMLICLYAYYPLPLCVPPPTPSYPLLPPAASAAPLWTAGRRPR